MVNRKDFRPSSSSSTMSEKDRAMIQSNRKTVGDRDYVIDNFVRGYKGKTSNESLSTDGNKLYSYSTVIATKQSDGTIVVNNTKYSQTTSVQQNRLLHRLQETKTPYAVTGGKPRGYGGEDFSETDLLRKHNYDVNSPEYKEDRKSLQKGSNQEAKEHPSLSKKEASQVAKDHLKENPNYYKQDKVDFNYMRTHSNDHFFDTKTMRFFKGSRYSTHYNESKGKNYIIVKSPYNTYGYHEYNVQTGKTTPVTREEVFQ